MYQASTTTTLLNPISAANTAAATSGWVDVRGAQGDLMFVCLTGSVTGSITWTVERATDSGGTGATGITPNEGTFSSGVTSNTIQKRTVNSNGLGPYGWIRVVGTIVTGPALVAASVSAIMRG